MKTIKGPAIFLAQFAGDAAPFNTLDSIAKWATDLGYKGIQMPSWDGRLFDLKNAGAMREFLFCSSGSAPNGKYSALRP